LRRLKTLVQALRITYYIVVITGIAVLLLDLYASRTGWDVRLASPPLLEPRATGFDIHLTLSIHNPSHSIVMAKLVWYSVYIGDTPVGQGMIPYLQLSPGDNTIKTTVHVDVVHLPCAAVESLAENNRLEVGVRGYATMTLTLFGHTGYRDITVPFESSVYSVDIPFSSGLKAALRVAKLLCAAKLPWLP
jgi:LEA14-like dessication related protein